MPHNSCRIEVVEPSHEAYSLLVKALTYPQPVKRVIDYDALALSYNATALRSVILIGAPEGYKLSNMIRVLEQRKLANNLDFSISRLDHDDKGQVIPPADRPIALMKISERPMRVIA